MSDPIVIVGAARTPMGSMQGCFSTVSAPELGAAAISAAIERAHLQPKDIDEVFMGCVLPAGQGQAPARQAAIAAKIPYSTGATTINKMCGSGMKATMLANDSLLLGNNHIIVSGGMESMTNAPYLLLKARSGYRLGHGELKDHMFLDGLEDAYDKGKLMGAFAEDTAKKYHFTREAQDNFAITSLKRAQLATQDKTFSHEITPVTFETREGKVEVVNDETPMRVKPEKIPLLKPAFSKDGTITAANSSSISDGAAALVLMKESEAKKRGLKPLAKIMGYSTQSQEPAWFTTAPVAAIKKLLDKIHWTVDQVDLFEINEAFAVVTMVAMHDLKIPHEKVNIHGGACALGHPIGASGARILVTLLYALQKHHLKRGIAALCIGGGEATAIAIEIF
ncbi:MAG: acetyl-CoA C-acyltransferase [Proteobacteria bacterium]|nr:acetyl-CoA C-acyltransferase [Pseudomonadota bacterium]